MLELVVQYGVAVSLSDVVHLDSSSEVKFSRHIIVRLPRAAFRDNQHVGGFVRHLVDAIAAEAADDDDMRRLMLWTRSPPTAATMDGSSSSGGRETAVPAPPIDCGVYSRHRSFRLLWSSKRKPHAPVLHCHHSQQYSRAASQRSTWLHSCVQFMERGRHDATDGSLALLSWPPQQADDSSGHESTAAATLSRSGNLEGGTLAARSSQPRCRQLSAPATGSAAPLAPACTCLPSALLPGPALCGLGQFLSDAWPAVPAAVTVVLRSQQLRRPAEKDTAGCGVSRVTLLFSVTGSRYCARVGRAHRSNGIYLVAWISFQATTALDDTAAARQCQQPQTEIPLQPQPQPQPQPTGLFVQRCHDVDCKGFSSEPVVMPVELLHRLLNGSWRAVSD